jgi:membrane associated rhomboid family serine protease
LTKARATAAIRLTANVAAQAAMSATSWIWLALGGLVVALVVAMGWFARQHRRRQAPA